MKAIFIDPSIRLIEQIDCQGKIQEMRDLMEVDLVTAVRVTAKDTLWLDDEGLLKTEDQDYFLWAHESGAEHGVFVYAGKGLILGSTPDGDNADCVMTIDDVERRLRWMDREDGLAAANEILSHPPEIVSFDSWEEMDEYLSGR